MRFQLSIVLRLNESRNMNNYIDGKEVTRRTFLKEAAAELGTIGMAGFTAEAKTTNLRISAINS